MPFERPTLDELHTRTRGDMEANMDAVPIVRQRSTLDGIARGTAGASHELHGHAAYIHRQMFADTADTEALERESGFRGLSRRAAASAVGSVLLTGDAGTAIPADTRLGSASGIEIATTEAAILGAEGATVAVRAVLAGSAGNLAAGAAVQFLSPVAGAADVGAIGAPGMGSGADAEDDAGLRARLLFLKRRPAHGGAVSDYVRWALEVPGVTRAWPASREMGLGTVTLRFAVDNALHGPIPNAIEVEAVRAHIEGRASADGLREGRPVTAELFVVAPVPLPVNVVLTSTPDDDATRAAIRAELVALLRAIGRPAGTVPEGEISQAISVVGTLTARTLIEPTDDIRASLGQLPVLGDVTWL